MPHDPGRVIYGRARGTRGGADRLRRHAALLAGTQVFRFASIAYAIGAQVVSVNAEAPVGSGIPAYSHPLVSWLLVAMLWGPIAGGAAGVGFSLLSLGIGQQMHNFVTDATTPIC